MFAGIWLSVGFLVTTWESVTVVIDGLGRVVVAHLIQLQKMHFKRISILRTIQVYLNTKNSCVR